MKSIYRTMALLLVGSVTAMWAQDYPQQPQPQPQGPDQADDQPTGPGKGIARISVINGEVSVKRGNGEVTAAALNAPLMAGDTILTGASARAELQFDSSSILRIAANSEVRMGDLQYHHSQIQVALGLVTFTVLRNSDSQNEIDLPSVAVHPTKQGAYRILVNQDGTAEITVRGGEAEIANPKGSQQLQAGQTMIVRGSQDDPEFQIANAARPDDWDRWNGQRDQELTRATSRQYVNPDITGAEDLDQHGRWVDDGSYGRVWVPQVDQDWAPYQDGRWTYGDDYGWTWIGAEPWGWAPYHYGRWYHSGFGWAWWPGPFGGPCYWSPALVGFFGFGGRVGFGFGFGSIGWVPLAPFERFHRWWGPGFAGRGFVVNNFNVYNSFRNARVAGGVRGVAATSFGRGAGRFTAVGGSELRSAGMVNGRLPVSPASGSTRMSDRSVNMSNFRQSGNTRFFSSNGSSRNVGGSQSGPSSGSRTGTFRGSQSPPSGQNGSTQNGWRGSNSGSQPQVRQGGGDPGWRRFNGPASGPNGNGNNRAPAQNYNAPRSTPNYSGGNNPSYNAPRNTPNYSAPRSAPSYNAPSYSAPRNAPSYNPPSYSAPRNSPSYSAPRSYSGPSYSAPRGNNAPSYSAPRSAPSYSAPRSAPSSGGGGGGNRGGGGGGSHGGGGGGGSRSSGGGGGHHR